MAHDILELAAITGAHGITGEVRLKLFGEGAEALNGFSQFTAAKSGANSGLVLSLTKARSDNKGGAIARFAEITTREAAEKLRGTLLTAPRGELPDLEDGEYYHADLLGLAAFTDTGEPIGKVIAVQNYGATDIVEIEREPAPEKGMKTFMVPLTREAVIEWDTEKFVIAADFAEG